MRFRISRFSGFGAAGDFGFRQSRPRKAGDRSKIAKKDVSDMGSRCSDVREAPSIYEKMADR